MRALWYVKDKLRYCDVCVYCIVNVFELFCSRSLFLSYRMVVAEFYSFLTMSWRNHSMLFGTTTRRSVHNHALASTADLARSTSFMTGRYYAGTLPPFSSPPGIEWMFYYNKYYQLCANELFLSSKFYKFNYWWWWFWLFILSLNKFHLSLVFLQMRVSGSRHTYNSFSSKSGITLLLLNWISSFNYFVLLKRGFV